MLRSAVVKEILFVSIHIVNSKSYVTMLREAVRAIDCTQWTQTSIIRASNFVLDFKLKKSYPLVKSNVRLGTKKKL